MATLDLDQYCVEPTLTIEEAIGLLDRLEQKLILVTSFNQELLGTVTDGDIRRGLLRHLTLDTPIQHIMNPEPHALDENGTHTAARRLMKVYGLTGVPQLDSQRRVVDILGIVDQPKKLDNAVFLMAGGFGKTTSSINRQLPKTDVEGG